MNFSFSASVPFLRRSYSPSIPPTDSMLAFSGAGAFGAGVEDAPRAALVFSGIGFLLPHHRLMCPGFLHLKQALLAIRSAFSLSDNCVNPPRPWYGGGFPWLDPSIVPASTSIGTIWERVGT